MNSPLRRSEASFASRERERAAQQRQSLDHPGRRFLTVAARGQDGFTLIELLVVLGIITVLAAILIPTVIGSWKKAKRTKLAADFATIGQALEEWKKDHNGQYPQVTQPNTGFAVLGRDLVGVYGDGVTGSPAVNDPNDPPAAMAGSHMPGDCVQASNVRWVALVANNDPTPTSPNWYQFDCNDLADGLGTRLVSGGKKVGPYLKPEAFRVRGCALLDPDDKPILYFPAKPGPTPNLSIMIGPEAPFVDYNGYGAANQSVFNAADNIEFFKRVNDSSQPNAVARIRALLGDTNNNGMIDNGETAASTGPYLLWAPGPDGLYGPEITTGQTIPTPTQITKCDDVTNFGK